MSEKILKALMQLFAIIARPGSSANDRKIVVESFLKRQLNNELIREYLKVFDEYYSLNSKTGEVVISKSYKEPKRYQAKEGYKLDHITGKFHEYKDSKYGIAVDKSEAVEFVRPKGPKEKVLGA